VLLENATGNKVPITIISMQPRDLIQIRSGWTPGFNWNLYLRNEKIEVYKIMVLGSERIEGAIALEPRGDHVWVHLIEKAPHNRGEVEKYNFVAHHLFAFASKRSFELADGFVAFDAKTNLIDHYRKNYGAEPVGSRRMIIPDIAGKHLINVYL